MKLSVSEQLGIDAIMPRFKHIYSVGISTYANAEIAMLQKNSSLNIIATTIDRTGLKSTQEKLNSLDINNIECKYEDVREKLPYHDQYFDFVYARLVLHYLTINEIDNALLELKRILKNDGKIYVVVRSIKEREYLQVDTTINHSTGLTEYIVNDFITNKPYTCKRRFYTIELLRKAFLEAGFKIDWCVELKETLY
jgi:ubiquinone/menaquinone biosynthesis C-methylase UbiE